MSYTEEILWDIAAMSTLNNQGTHARLLNPLPPDVAVVDVSRNLHNKDLKVT